jgi:Methyladenine glycosylase
VFETGLSWSIVFGKRDAFRKAFHNFNVAKVAAMTDQDVDRLLQNPSIIRNRAKIKATVDNARAMMSASPSLPALAKSYENGQWRAAIHCRHPLVHTTGGLTDIASWVPRACTRSCRTLAWSTTTSEGASERPAMANLWPGPVVAARDIATACPATSRCLRIRSSARSPREPRPPTRSWKPSPPTAAGLTAQDTGMSAVSERGTPTGHC